MHDFDEEICFPSNCCYGNRQKIFFQWSIKNPLKKENASLKIFEWNEWIKWKNWVDWIFDSGWDKTLQRQEFWEKGPKKLKSITTMLFNYKNITIIKTRNVNDKC